eukprot:5161040-Amphidinium_carterae.1
MRVAYTALRKICGKVPWEGHSPELFADLNINVVNHWKRPSQTNAAGRLAVLKDAHITVLSELAEKLTKELPMTAPALQSVFNEQFASLSEPKRVSLTWTRAFLHDIGYSFRKMQRKAAAEIEPHVAALHQQNLAQKVRYMQHMYDIPDDKVHNLDETSCRVLPLAEKCWASQAEGAVQVGDSLLQMTCTLAMLLVFGRPYFSQLLFAGKSSRCLPGGNWPCLLMDFTENHWQSAGPTGRS